MFNTRRTIIHVGDEIFQVNAMPFGGFIVFSDSIGSRPFFQTEQDVIGFITSFARTDTFDRVEHVTDEG